MKYQNEFSFQFQSLKHFSFQGTLNFDAHFHEDYEVVYVISGEYEFTVDGQTEMVSPGDFCFVIPNKVHSCRTKDRIHIWFADFSPDLIGTFTYDMRNKKGSTFRFNGRNTSAEMLLSRYISEFSEYNEDQFLYGGRIDCKYDAQALLYAICSEFVHQVEIVSDATPSSILISLVAEYVQKHFREDISLTQMAADLNYDRFYLSHLFNKVFQMNFRQYINSCRIAHAKQLMMETKDSITSIAGECGYQSLRTFNNAFFALSGVAPSVYRSQAVHTPLWSINVAEPVFIQSNLLRTERSHKD